MKKPPIIVLFEGTSLIPNQGSHTQNIPPITSVKDINVSSAAGICLDPIEYKINPKQTKVPCVAKRAWFLADDRKFKSLETKIIEEIIAQINPAIATVVNFGVSFRHLKETEKIEKPIADVIPRINPISVPLFSLSNAMITIPKAATIIEIQTLKEIFSFKNKKPNNAVINGIAAKHKSVIAADVDVIDQINDIIAAAKPALPIIPDKPILK